MIRLSSHLHLRHYIHLHSELEEKPCIVLPLCLSHREIDFHMGGTSSAPHHLHGPQATCNGEKAGCFFVEHAGIGEERWVDGVDAPCTEQELHQLLHTAGDAEHSCAAGPAAR